ncbi:MAG: hypothetical protein HQL72_10570 [Magnetococcales bacterium]|nr:hypothetical protein [Magnetococcales bacterium]
MGQRIDGRLDGLRWMGDMEPEYEETLEWMNLMDTVQGVPDEDRLSLHWSVVANALSRVSGGFAGGSNPMQLAAVN